MTDHPPFAEHDYSLFGLRIRSSFPLPELAPIERHAEADVSIRRGKVEVPKDIEGLHASGDALVLVIPKVAAFRISGGDLITVDAAPGVPDRNIRLFLLGSAFGALLHQRKLLPLHANAIEIDGKAVAFMGESGAGKSTLAAWFHDRGCRVLADDVCVVRFDAQERAVAYPGLARLRLWQDAVELTRRDPGLLERSLVGAADSRQKYDVPLAAGGSQAGELPLHCLYLLNISDEFRIERLQGVPAASAVFENTYRGSFLNAANAQEAHWEAAVRLVRNVAVWRVERIWSLDRFDEQASLLLEHARRVRS